jgi:hypothetical protein
MNVSTRKSAIALAAFAMVGSTLFGGAALAGDNNGHGHDKGQDNTEHTGGPGGSGGEANAQCLIPIGISLGIFGEGGDISQCDATGGAGGTGGAGSTSGTGAEY